MSDSASEAIETFLQVAAALERRDWKGAAALCDPVSLRIFHRQLLEQFAPRIRHKLTADDIRRHQPDMPIEVAEYQLSQFQRQAAERLSQIDDEVAGVASLPELAALDPSEAFARWLEAHDPQAQVRRLVARHPEVVGSREIGVTALPADRMEPLGAVVEEPFAFVVYRRSWAANDAAAEVHRDEFLKPYSEEERAWLRQTGVGLVQVATLRRQPDRSWRLPAEHSFLQGMTWFAQGHIVAISEEK
jgi:hypothetical protein